MALLDLLGIEGNLTNDNQGVILETVNGSAIRLNCGEITLGEYRPEQFKILIVKTRDYLEKQTRKLQVRQNRIGWIFPINALVSRDNIPEDRWAEVYSNFAINGLIYNEELYSLADSPSEIVGELSLSDFYSDKIAVVVLGCDEINKQELSVDEIKVMLTRFGYLPIIAHKNAEAVIEMENEHVENGVVKIARPSKDLLEYLQHFEWLISRAMEEVLLAKIFEVSIRIYSAS